ncbi:hypothetical protein D3C84_386160 [compost metagenome]
MGREGIGRCPATVSGELDKGAGGLREGAFPVGEQGVHLNGGAERQTGHRQHGAGRQVAGEEFAINAVDRLQIPHVLEEEGHFHHVVHDVADALDYGLDIGQALSGLGLDIATYQFACPGIDRQLGGNIVVVGEGHALGVGAQILGGMGGISCSLDDGATHRIFLFLLFVVIAGYGPPHSIALLHTRQGRSGMAIDGPLPHIEGRRVLDDHCQSAPEREWIKEAGTG